MEFFVETFGLFLFGLGALITKAVVILTVVFLMLKMANKSLGIKMKDVIEKINEDPQALSDYFGRRLIAAAIVILGVSLGALSF